MFTKSGLFTIFTVILVHETKKVVTLKKFTKKSRKFTKSGFYCNDIDSYLFPFHFSVFIKDAAAKRGWQTKCSFTLLLCNAKARELENNIVWAFVHSMEYFFQYPFPHH